MALVEKEFLISEAEVIRNETDDGKNTAERVGKMFVDIINGVSNMTNGYEEMIGAAVETEKNQRESADGALSRSINNEAGARQAADQALQLAVDSEANEREEADNELRALIAEMGSSVWPVVMEMAASSSVLEYQEGGRAVTVTGSVLRKGVAVPTADITSVRLKVGADDPADLPVRASVNQIVTVSSLGANTIVLFVTAYGETYTKSITVNLEKAMYFGFSQAAAAADVTLESLVKQPIALSPKGDRTMNNQRDGNYLWLCVPNRMSISKVTSSGFDVPMEAAVETGGYKYYRSAAAILAGEMHFTIQ